MCNEIEDMDASSEGVVPTGDVESGSESNTQIKRISPRLRTIPTRIAYIHYQKTLHLLHKHSPCSLTRRRRSGEIVMVSKAKLIEKQANDIEPTTLRQALQTQDAEKWKEACEAEHESLLRNKTYVPVS